MIFLQIYIEFLEHDEHKRKKSRRDEDKDSSRADACFFLKTTWTTFFGLTHTLFFKDNLSDYYDFLGG